MLDEGLRLLEHMQKSNIDVGRATVCHLTTLSNLSVCKRGMLALPSSAAIVGRLLQIRLDAQEISFFAQGHHNGESLPSYAQKSQALSPYPPFDGSIQMA